ncbi:MAG: hypothetical protein FWG92_02350 [Leptospirales bacterium]|nr:hypothetical protein [Leptospirales bacterium]
MRNKIFQSDAEAMFIPTGEFLPIKNKKSSMNIFFQGGISFPVSNKYDVFVLMHFFDELISDLPASLSITNYRAGVAWKF